MIIKMVGYVLLMMIIMVGKLILIRYPNSKNTFVLLHKGRKRTKSSRAVGHKAGQKGS